MYALQFSFHVIQHNKNVAKGGEGLVALEIISSEASKHTTSHIQVFSLKLFVIVYIQFIPFTEIIIIIIIML